MMPREMQDVPLRVLWSLVHEFESAGLTTIDVAQLRRSIEHIEKHGPAVLTIP